MSKDQTEKSHIWLPAKTVPENTILQWNLKGLKPNYSAGLTTPLDSLNPSIICLRETKLPIDHLIQMAVQSLVLPLHTKFILEEIMPVEETPST